MIVSGDKTRTTAHELCAWLNTLDGTRHDARPVFVRIGNTIYSSGAQYTDSVGETVIYLLGPLPRSYARRSLYAITAVEADPMLWYVSGYFPGRPGDEENPQYARYHPFGRMVMLRRSDVPVKATNLPGPLHGWLIIGARGGTRPIQNIKRIPLETPEPEKPQADVIRRELLIWQDRYGWFRIGESNDKYPTIKAALAAGGVQS